MKDCTVEMTARSGGQTSRFSMRGTLERAGGLIVSYEEDGDRVRLFLAPSEMTMRRESATVLAMRFCEGETTFLRFGEENGEADVPVRTYRYALNERGDAVSVLLRYKICYPVSPQYVSLRADIKIISEEK